MDGVQGDLLVERGKLDSPLHGKPKNARSMMVYNFFALTKEKRTEPIRYSDGNVTIEVKGTDAGIATIYDKEFLIYIASLMVEKLNRGEEVGATLRVAGHDFFRASRKTDGGRNYERLASSIERLQGTQIKTNLETGGEGSDDWFSWVSSARTEYKRNKAGEKVLHAVTVTVCDWLHRAIVKDRHILTYDPAYFDLPPLERRLYEMARAHCGDQPGFKINIEKLRLRVGAEMDLKKFSMRLRALEAQKTPLPEYGLRIIDPRTTESAGPGAAAGPAARNQARNRQVIFWKLDRWRDFQPEAFPEAE